MELPDEFKKLYRHWELHTLSVSKWSDDSSVFKDKKPRNGIFVFVRERISIWSKKYRGELAPYTNDPVLGTYRFCNIFREFDRQTIEFHTLLNPLRDNFPLWLLNMFYYRMVARTETITTVGLLSFDKKENKNLYKRLMHSSRPRFGTPYVFPVSVIQRSKTPTRELFITEYLPTIMEAVAEEIATWDRKNVHDGLESVIKIFKYNLYFLWTEVLIDVAYQFPEYINLFGRFPIGPGSLPTMQRVDKTKDPTLLVQELSLLPIDTRLTYNGKPIRLSAENWEGIGCEFRKYTNLKAGKGRRRIFSSR